MLTIENNSIHFQKNDEHLQLLKQSRNEFLLLQFLKSNPLITELTFFGCDLSDNDLKIILNLIKKCPNLITLNLSENKLTDRGFSFLGQQLPRLRLQSLTVSGNQGVTHKGILALAQGVRRSGVHTLSLSRLLIKDCITNVIGILQGSKVKHLDVSTTGLTQSQVAEIANRLNNTAITSFNAESNLLKDEGTSQLTQLVNRLRMLNISYNGMSGNALAAVADHVRDSTLTELSVDGTTLLPQALAQLTQAMEFNRAHNQPQMLSQAYLAGFTLHCMERQAQCTLPIELIIEIASLATQSKVQSDAFIHGRMVAKNVKMHQLS